MHAVRSAARPKLSLAVPTASKPCVPQLIIPVAASVPRPLCTSSTVSPMTPTARNTLFNQRAASTLQVPSFERGTPAKKNSKRVTFSDAPARVELISPLPRDYYGDYIKTREERRWNRS